MRRCTLLALLLMSGAAQGAASCGELPTQAEMNQCAAQDYARVERELTERYGEYRARLSEEHRRELHEVQAAWTRFRDLSCRFESSGVRGGSAHPFVLNSCLAAMTRARLREIRALASCKEGDLSCPAWK